MAKSVMTLGNNDDLKLKLEQIIDEAWERGIDEGKKKSTLHCWTKKEIEACNEETYQRGYEDGVEHTAENFKYEISNTGLYQSGLNDAWECCRRITNETSVVLSKIFGEVDASAVFQLYTPQEAMRKIKDYERKQKWAEQSKRGKEHRDEIEKMLERKKNEDNYVDAIVKVRVPKWQIGEKVNLYFKDTMSINGVCERKDK